MIKKARCSAWHLPLHYAYVIFFILLTILLPLLYSRTGYPPLWFIWTLLGTLLFFYAVYWVGHCSLGDTVARVRLTMKKKDHSLYMVGTSTARHETRW
ncbi:uncharacterized protein BYT42DRAFT_554163 [Radiomyces spectabilis]|uniref:uncharacterized protein n=1 Tax=Radiomyces spectabilis TaxID=64574 RepID=UPI00221F7CA6|nr:uncharacterized protein BYT42DRAFT_554163 [Radiomyces spectabilis]KAI8394306.1 hypothetical protein BYT42DRAFT_554163 [Radiomyces spectabilis]